MFKFIHFFHAFSLTGILLIALTAPRAFAASSTSDQLVCERYKAIESQLRSKSLGNLGDGCGPSGYLLNFGYYYCSVFVQKNSQYSAQGQRVLRNIRKCLIHSLEAAPTTLTCGNVRSVGIASHVNCYVNSGYCGISSDDRWSIILTLIHEAGSAESSAVFSKINQACQSKH
jgi:hypothetical protein